MNRMNAAPCSEWISVLGELKMISSFCWWFRIVNWMLTQRHVCWMHSNGSLRKWCAASLIVLDRSEMHSAIWCAHSVYWERWQSHAEMEQNEWMPANGAWLARWFTHIYLILFIAAAACTSCIPSNRVRRAKTNGKIISRIFKLDSFG